jgi:LacI family transcriptional regulator
MAITIKDIAKSAKVSIATVSRVLNDPLRVSDEKRIRVAKAIKELGYKPNALARGLIKGSIETIGILIQDINNLFYPEVIRGIENELEKNGYSIFLCNTDGNIEKEKKYIATLRNKNVDGIIFLGTRHVGLKENEHIIDLSCEMPIMLINDYILGSDVYTVMTDEVNGAYKAINYLISLGHRKIAFINGEGDYSTFQYKFEGYKKALLSNEIEINDRYIFKAEPFEKSACNAAKKMLSLDKPPTAIFTAGDQMAIGVMKAIYEYGFAIPKDFSLIGFGDAPIAESLYPGLTTVNQFPYKTGKLAAEVILRLVNKEVIEQKKIIIEPQLSLRNSCRQIE